MAFFKQFGVGAPPSDSDILQRYRQTRELGIKLSNEILSHYKESILFNVLKEMELLHGNAVKMDSEEETDSIMNYSIYEYTSKGKTTLKRYIDEVGAPEGSLEAEILRAKLNSTVGFYKIIRLQPTESTLTLRPLQQKNAPDVVLTETGLSRSALKGTLLYVRIIDMGDFSMTSGVSFPFPERNETYVLRNYESQGRKFKAATASARNYLGVKKLSKTHGIEVRHSFGWQK